MSELNEIIETHGINVERLQKLETELIDLIVESDNENLKDKFLEWQKQRTTCNESYLQYVEGLVNKSKNTE